MKRLIAVTTLSAALILFAGCVRIRVHRTSDKPPIGDISTESSVTVAEGLIPTTPPIVLTERCSTHWETLTTDETTLQVVLRFITLNIYSPYTARVECAKPKPVVKQEWR